MIELCRYGRADGVWGSGGRLARHLRWQREESTGGFRAAKGRLAGCLVVPEGRFDWRFGATEGRIDWEFGPWTAEWSKGLGLAEGGLNGGTLEGFGVEDLGRQRLKSARNLGRLRVQSV
ncbi:hypothetical protein Acr_24g0008650 [Actinidia rufa]|uniref:Uncharacterized protein n=1 Tax=Actinidia rufa TaxID=165716 RepID=A0A7J0GUZ8_9ERIC|nr:hypothetical protein Acr_24g0008650 [Actinidia rufa]